MGSSKKHKEKDRERSRKHHKSSRPKSRSRSKERDPELEYRGKRSHRSSRKEEKFGKRRRKDSPIIDLGLSDSDVEAVTNFAPERSLRQAPSQKSEVREISLKENSLSIDLANKLRAKLGLKPLHVIETIPGIGDGDIPADKAEGEGDSKKEVFVRTENISDKKEIEKFREKLMVQKEKRKNLDKLRKVKGLGEGDSEEETAKNWISKSRSIEKEKEAAEKRAKLLEEMDQEFGIGTLVEEEFNMKKHYSVKDLDGLTVAHSTNSFDEGSRIILTLQDKAVLEEGDDVLVNVNMVDNEKAKVNTENRKNKPAYQPYEEPEYDEFGILKKKNVLSKYDEVIDKPQQDSFVIGQKIKPVSKEKQLEIVRMKLKQKQIVSLDMPTQKIASEYYSPSEMVEFKKPKKKRKIMKRSGFKASDLQPLPDETAVIADHGSRRPVRNYDWESLPLTTEDDDENNLTLPEEEKTELKLQEALLRRQKVKGTDFKAKLKNIKAEEDFDIAPPKDKLGSNIVLNSTAEFCRSLGELPIVSSNWDEEAEEMDFEQEFNEENYLEDDLKHRGTWNEVEIEDMPVDIAPIEAEPILEEEPDASSCVADALKLAMAKGYLDKEDSKNSGSTTLSMLKAQSYTIEEKFYDEDKFGRHERYGGPTMDFREKDSYKPEVQLEYIDDGGRKLNCKEAFRYLSHKFHGKGPAKNKIDKRMKKQDQDAKLRNMSSTDTPLRTLKLLQEKQKELHSPYVVLSGGSKALTQSSIVKQK